MNISDLNDDEKFIIAKHLLDDCNTYSFRVYIYTHTHTHTYAFVYKYTYI